MIKVIGIDEVNNFISDPAVFDEISEDGTIYPLNVPVIGGFSYLGLFEENNLIGMTCIHPRGDAKEVHISIKKPFQHKARELLMAAVAGHPKVYGSIPEFKKNVLNLAHKCGFEQIGEDGYFLKNSVKYRRILCLLSQQL